MKVLCRSSAILIIALMAAASSAYAQQPPDVVSSDTNLDTAMGTNALAVLSGGPGYNTAAGAYALAANSTGGGNSAFGADALNNNTTGIDNTAAGAEALLLNETGGYNTVTGYYAMHNNTTGQQNTATGVYALHNNVSGSFNTAVGVDALYGNKGSSNIAEGYKAGYSITSGSNNIDIGNQGMASDNDTIRIGASGSQTGAYMAGIWEVQELGFESQQVYVGQNGQLGVFNSSQRFKTAIVPMGSNTAKLAQLRPVTFRYKADPRGTVQYGLIAEEVARVYPELVIHDKLGRVTAVRYDQLAPMLLNEVQKQQTEKTAQDAKIRELEERVAEMHAEFLNLRAKDERIAQR